MHSRSVAGERATPHGVLTAWPTIEIAPGSPECPALPRRRRRALLIDADEAFLADLNAASGIGLRLEQATGCARALRLLPTIAYDVVLTSQAHGLARPPKRLSGQPTAAARYRRGSRRA